jgi:hypothetical protein
MAGNENASFAPSVHFTVNDGSKRKLSGISKRYNALSSATATLLPLVRIDFFGNTDLAFTSSESACLICVIYAPMGSTKTFPYVVRKGTKNVQKSQLRNFDLQLK